GLSRSGRRFVRRRRGSHRRGRRQLRASLGLLVTTDRVLELTHARAERAADFREPLGAEEQQSEQKKENDLHGADVWHGAHRSRVLLASGTAENPPTKPFATMCIRRTSSSSHTFEPPMRTAPRPPRVSRSAAARTKCT